MAGDLDKLERKLDKLLATSGDIQADVRVLRHNHNNLRQSLQAYQDMQSDIILRVARLELENRDTTHFIAAFKRVLWIAATPIVVAFAAMLVYLPAFRSKL